MLEETKSQKKGRRAASTKTRIETQRPNDIMAFLKGVAGRHPLKQGLKHDAFCIIRSHFSESQGGIH